MWIALVIVSVIFALLIYEFRFRRPDRIVLREFKGRIRQSANRFYPRHFRLAIPAVDHSLTSEMQAEAKGKLGVCVRLVVTVAALLEHLPELIRVAGWNEDAVDRAAGELDVRLQALVRGFTEKHEIEDLSTEHLSKFLGDQLKTDIHTLGLEMRSLHVQSIDPIDEDIAAAVRRREADRIIEQTEVASQKARVAASKANVEADEKIAYSEHIFSLKKLDLKKKEEEKESELARKRVEDELDHRRMQLDVDREEIALIKNNPELVVLSPQVTRLAEASQGLRNARTVVSISPNDITEGSPIAGILQSLLQRIGQPVSQKDKKPTKSSEKQP